MAAYSRLRNHALRWITRIIMHKAKVFRGCLLLMATACVEIIWCAAFAAEPPPVTPVRPVTDTYFGTDVVDNYRYLENVDDPQVQTWMRAQADYTRAALDRPPGREPLLQRIHTLNNTDLSRRAFARRGQRYFYETVAPGAPLPKLYYRDDLNGEEHLLLDPAALGAGTSTHYALDFYTPSWDGRFVAYGVSAGGSENSVLRVLDVQSGKTLEDSIDRTSNSVIAWRSDNRSFFYLRYAKRTPTMRAAEMLYNARTYLHTLGTHTDGEGDPLVFGRGVSDKIPLPEGQVTFLVLSPDSPFALAVANHNDDANPSTLFVAPVARINGIQTPWHRFAEVDDGITRFALHGDKLYFLSQHGASHFRLLRTSLAPPDVGHAERIEADPGRGKRAWVQSARVLSYEPAASATTDPGLVTPSSVDFSQMEAEEVFATSYEGTRVPLSILHKKGLTLDGSHPTILTGYGAYGLSLEPGFSPTALAWLERGNVLAIAHVRGGGEYGEAWHLAGEKLTKLNTVFDFIACAEYLINQQYTAPKYLAGRGGSAGGITVGGALTWRPDLFSVILDQVGISDTLRVELTPNGPPNISELGSVQNEEGFHGLYAMGAYFHVRDGTAYPAVLFTTGANDPRVAPWQMTKMTARVQAETRSDRPVPLRVDYDAGHGMGSTKSQNEMLTADLWSFALWHMGDPAFQPNSQ